MAYLGLPKGHSIRDDSAFNPLNCMDMDCRYDELYDPDMNHDALKNSKMSCEYYSQDQFSKLIPICSFSSLHLNVRSLPKNYDHLTAYLTTLNHSFSVMAFCETWLKDDITDLYSFSHYNAVHSCRENKVGGGVSIYVLNNLIFVHRRELSEYLENIQIESLFIEIRSCSSLNGKNIVVGCIYRNPDSDISIFNDALHHTLEKINREHKICVLLGDYNINLIKSELPTSADFLNVLSSTYFYPLIQRPTRITSTSSTLIDNILINSLEFDITSGILLTDISDHLPVFKIIHINDNMKIKHDTSDQAIPKHRRFTKHNIDTFKSMISGVSWNGILKSHDVNEAYQLFQKLFISVFNTCFPLISPKPNNNSKSKPWFNKDCRKMITRKNQLYKKSITSPTPLNVETYKKYKNKFIISLRKAKKKYFSNKFTEALNDIKTTWGIINQLLNRKKAPPAVISEMVGRAGTLLDPKEIADGFNEFFVNIGVSLASSIRDSQENPCNVIEGQFSSLCNFHPPSSKEVRQIILQLKNSAEGHDGIRSMLMKETIDYIIEPLIHILSLSLESGIIPQDLKIAKVIPVYKTGDSKVFSNFRPISILPCFSKILEKIVYTRISNHLTVNNILYPHQYGFRKCYSTEHALLHLVNNISTALDDKKFALGVFLDLSKAFDTVNHRTLISKLHRYGVDDVALLWLSNYISDREQFVYINGISSKKTKIICGVPQGSILGPLLFLIYINDLASSCNHLLPILFADDTNLVASHQNFKSLIQCVNAELSIVSKWFEVNKLTLNVSKCNFMVFSNINRNYDTEDAAVFINGQQIPQVSSTKFLGVMVDCNLTWNDHINLVCSRSMKTVGILRKVLPFIHPTSHLTLYYSLLFPYLNYCNIVWAATFSSYTSKLLLIQKRFLRMISHSNYYEPSAPLFRQYSLLTMEKLNIYQTCLFIFKVLNHKQSLPVSLSNLFNLFSDSHSYQTRHRDNFVLPYCRTSKHQCCITFRGPQLWNSLPQSLKIIKSLTSFKKMLKEHLILS